jgi:superfamily I DNA/RNA helicase
MGKECEDEHAELQAVIDRILASSSRRRLVVAGPGTGKTRLFRRILEAAHGSPDRFLVLTFNHNLGEGLETDLGGLAEVSTLHSYCLGLLHRNQALRGRLSSNFRCFPGLATLVKDDWKFIRKSKAPQFVGEMRNLERENHVAFYLERGAYYDAVDFDDTVYRVHESLSYGAAVCEQFDIVLVDEYQDFNRLEAAFIGVMGQESPLVVVGDDDQALYSQLRGSSWDHIRLLYGCGEYETFELPFCMRCPKVVVDAVNDVIARARDLHKLEGRIQKPYKYFAPVKKSDSEKYPKIAVVRTTVQSKKCNYMGQYVAQEIARIPSDEIETAVKEGYPPALVIVNKPYREQIIRCLEEQDIPIDTKQDSPDELGREQGLSILKEDPTSNLGWRIVLYADAPSFVADVIARSADGEQHLVDILPQDFRTRVLADVAAYKPPADGSKDGQQHASESGFPPVKVTTFEGAKGLSAQHVFIVGIHDGELPRNSQSIQDLEICKFIVGLTRTHKMCSLIYTHHFGDKWMEPSTFISWIDSSRLERVDVNADYWKL